MRTNTPNEYVFGQGQSSLTVFAEREGTPYLRNLVGMECGNYYRGAVDEDLLDEIFYLNTNRGYFTPRNSNLIRSEFSEDEIFFEWSIPCGNLSLTSTWTFHKASGVWRRQDSLHNAGNEGIYILSSGSRFIFSPGAYELYSQGSRWCGENQGVWQDINHATLVLSSKGGRTNQGNSPFVMLRDNENGRSISFHIIPRGDWLIRISSHVSTNDRPPYIIAELGHSDANLNLRLKPGQNIRLPDILFYGTDHSQDWYDAGKFHSYLLENSPQNRKGITPIIYNTWFDQFEFLDVERLRMQLAGAKEIGCEVFAVDAGWYGAGEAPWAQQVGDWREKRAGAFYGEMRGFAEEVREAGLGFGIWMEPERISKEAPIFKESPKLFARGEDGFYYPKLWEDEAYAYTKDEIRRLIEDYDLAWIKIDYNFSFGVDDTGSNFLLYYSAWNDLFDELRQEYPRVFFEGCASGGMRFELNSMERFDCHFLSDSVDPIDVLRISQGALLKYLPGNIGKWAVLRGYSNTIPKYGLPIEKAPHSIVAPSGSGWDNCYVANVDFILRVAMCGVLGVSGDLTTLPEEILERIKWNISIYKKWRDLIRNSIAYMLEPPRLQHDRGGWVAIQLMDRSGDEGLLFVYRLNDGCDTKTYRLKALNGDDLYIIYDADNPEAILESSKGAALMGVGTKFSVDTKNSAKVYIIKKTR
ncbi:MAG TPA: alpha-galactosidase [Clostridia bacterium]|nr:alpha-galactosidase [Clostridia bacterium]